MRLTPLQKLILVAGLQLFLLAALLGFKGYTVLTGETIVLAVAPVDPRDPFRGDYVTVRYDISTIDSDEVAGDDYVEGTVYVELREGSDGYWDAVALHEKRERSFDGTLLIKGHIESQNYGLGAGYSYEIDYGIEEVFIPEGSGTTVAEVPRGHLGVEVKVDRYGNAVARHFVVDGAPLDLERQ
ncbi:MAG: GDYXXLXY domain-containing protein [Dehalococcoidia bacterium]